MYTKSNEIAQIMNKEYIDYNNNLANNIPNTTTDPLEHY